MGRYPRDVLPRGDGPPQQQEAAEGLCGSCGYRFRYDAAFWRARGLQAPTHCRTCRAQRRREPVERRAGTVALLRHDYGFLEDEAGRRLFFHFAQVRAEDLPLEEGTGVTFEASYTEPTDGRAPKAFVVRRA